MGLFHVDIFSSLGLRLHLGLIGSIFSIRSCTRLQKRICETAVGEMHEVLESRKRRGSFSFWDDGHVREVSRQKSTVHRAGFIFKYDISLAVIKNIIWS